MFLSDPRSGPITIAEPADTRSFAERLRDSGAEGFQYSGQTEITPQQQKQMEALSRLTAAAERETMFTRLTSSRTEAMATAADNRIATVRQQTGAELENPFRQGYLFPARARVDAARGRGEDVGPVSDAVRRAQRDIFNERLDDLATKNPDKAPALQFGQSLDEQAGAIATAASDEAKSARADFAAGGGGIAGGLAAEVAGGIYGSRRDPLSIVSLVMGPTVAAGKAVLTRLFTAAAAQGLFNLGIETLQHPSAEMWRRERGEKPGSMFPSPGEAGIALLSGAIPGVAIQGAIEGAGMRAVSRVLAGEGRAGDLERAMRHIGVEPADIERRAFDAGVRQNDSAAIATAGLPRGAVRDDGLAQAVAHAEDPVHTPPAELPLPVPARPREQVNLLDEAAPGARETVDGKPVEFMRLDARDVGTDATEFQFKGGGDATGVTDRLRNVTQWDPLAAGKFFFYQFADGRVVVADGHQRLGLAKRLSAEQNAQIPLDGYVFRAVDGWTTADVRALAAKKNMQEGTGDALDVARVIRDRPDLVDGRLPVAGPTMKNAMAIARLSDEAFGMVVNGVVPPNYAAAVGGMVADPLNHAAVIADLARFAPATEREARLLIGEIQSAGFTAAHQIDLFGASDARRSLMAERVKVLDQAMQSLVQDKKLFGTLAKQADTIEAAGNALARDVNAARAQDAAALGDLVARLAQRTGPVSDALNRAADRVANGQAKGKAANEFLDELRGLLDRDGVQGLLSPSELRPRVSAEPGTPEALASAEAAFSSRADSTVRKSEGPATQGPAAGEAIQRPPEGQSAPDTFETFIAGQKGVPLADLHARAQVLQTELGAVGRELEAATGIRFVDPGIKKFTEAERKIPRKGYEDAGQLTDLARGGFIPKSAEEVDQVVAALTARFEVLDEGWKVTPVGYRDRKLLVRGADGTVAEIQIIPEAMYRAKKEGGGQKLYDAWRKAPVGPEREALGEQQIALYGEASAALDASFGKSSAPNLGSKVERQAASDMTAPSEATSKPSTDAQGAPGLSTANATGELTEPTSTAGRQSQLTKTGEAIPENVSPPLAPDKAEPSLLDAVAIAGRSDGSDTRLMSRQAALEEADKPALYSDLFASCKV